MEEQERPPLLERRPRERLPDAVLQEAAGDAILQERRACLVSSELSSLLQKGTQLPGGKDVLAARPVYPVQSRNGQCVTKVSGMPPMPRPKDP